MKPTQKSGKLLTRYRQSNNGLLSVGIKLHCRVFIPKLDEFMWKLKETADSWENLFQRKHSVQTWVFPPVGSAKMAIALIEVLEESLGISIFGNNKLEIQICSPGRLSPENVAFLTIGKYLGSDRVVLYGEDDLETSFSNSRRAFEKMYADPQPRWGRRLALYDHSGDFDRDFDWWHERDGLLIIENHLPFKQGRTDIHDASTRVEIETVNLLATVLAHQQYGGYWGPLGEQVKSDITQLLIRHHLSGVLSAPWVTTGLNEHADDTRFFDALLELMMCAWQDQERLRSTGKRGASILFGMHQIIQAARDEIRLQCELAQRGKS